LSAVKFRSAFDQTGFLSHVTEEDYYGKYQTCYDEWEVKYSEVFNSSLSARGLIIIYNLIGWAFRNALVVQYIQVFFAQQAVIRSIQITQAAA